MRRYVRGILIWAGALSAGIAWGIVATGWFAPVAGFAEPPFGLIAASASAIAASVSAVVFGFKLPAASRIIAGTIGLLLGTAVVILLSGTDAAMGIFAVLFMAPLPLALAGVVASVLFAREWHHDAARWVFLIYLTAALGGLLALAASGEFAAGSTADMEALYLMLALYLVSACAFASATAAAVFAAVRAVREHEPFGVE
ncbi:MAG: hypothetical protein Kow0067_01490 [Coriobacteriia bacterium]